MTSTKRTRPIALEIPETVDRVHHDKKHALAKNIYTQVAEVDADVKLRLTKNIRRFSDILQTGSASKSARLTFNEEGLSIQYVLHTGSMHTWIIIPSDMFDNYTLCRNSDTCINLKQFCKYLLNIVNIAKSDTLTMTITSDTIILLSSTQDIYDQEIHFRCYDIIDESSMILDTSNFSYYLRVGRADLNVKISMMPKECAVLLDLEQGRLHFSGQDNNMHSINTSINLDTRTVQRLSEDNVSFMQSFISTHLSTAKYAKLCEFTMLGFPKHTERGLGMCHEIVYTTKNNVEDTLQIWTLVAAQFIDTDAFDL